MFKVYDVENHAALNLEYDRWRWLWRKAGRDEALAASTQTTTENAGPKRGPIGWSWRAGSESRLLQEPEAAAKVQAMVAF